MLQTTYIREHRDLILERYKKRNFDGEEIINQIIKLDDDRKSTQQALDAQLAEGNKLAKEIGQLFKEGKQQEAIAAKEQTKTLKESGVLLKEEQNKIAEELKGLLYQLPNVPNEIVPPGKSEDDNETIFEEGDIPVLHENAVPHWELAKKYNLIDFELTGIIFN